jgi:hypothetical protein
MVCDRNGEEEGGGGGKTADRNRGGGLRGGGYQEAAGGCAHSAFASTCLCRRRDCLGRGGSLE